MSDATPVAPSAPAATLIVSGPVRVEPGQAVALCAADLHEYVQVLRLPRGPWPRARVGNVLAAPDGTPVLRLIGRHDRPLDPEPATTVFLAEGLTHFDLGPSPIELSVIARGLSLAYVTLSDKGALGQRHDAAGPAIAAEAAARLELSLVRGRIIPDDPALLRAILTDLALIQGFDLVVTTGGTGLGPRDTTPEATLAVIERRLPGFEAAMLAASMPKTPHAVISRAVAGTLGQTLILNLPGSPKAVRENLAAVLPAIPHALAKLQGDPADCGGP